MRHVYNLSLGSIDGNVVEILTKGIRVLMQKQSHSSLGRVDLEFEFVGFWTHFGFARPGPLQDNFKTTRRKYDDLNIERPIQACDFRKGIVFLGNVEKLGRLDSEVDDPIQ
jgi:hypothetical protein